MWQRIALAALIVSGLMLGAAQAAYPERPIKIVFPNAAGGEADIILRLIVPHLEKLVPQPIVVTAMPGAGTALGTRYVHDQPADGYTILYIHQAMLGTAAQGILGFEHSEFVPFARTGILTPYLVARDGLPFSDVGGLLSYAKANPSTVSAAIFLTAHSHLSFLRVQDTAGIQLKLINIPGGGAPVRAALLGGHVDIGVMGSAQVQDYAKAGGIKPLAFLAGSRDPALPDIPTAREQGLDHEWPVSMWWWFRKEVPVEIQTWWADRIERVMADPTLQQDLRTKGGLVDTSFARGAPLRAEVDAEAAAYRAVVEKYGLRKTP